MSGKLRRCTNQMMMSTISMHSSLVLGEAKGGGTKLCFLFEPRRWDRVTPKTCVNVFKKLCIFVCKIQHDFQNIQATKCKIINFDLHPIGIQGFSLRQSMVGLILFPKASLNRRRSKQTATWRSQQCFCVCAEN